MPDVVYGWNAVAEALESGEQLDEVLMAEGASPGGGHGRTLKLARKRGVPLRRVPRAALDRLSDGAVHQGILAKVADYAYRDLNEILAVAIRRGEPPFLLVLDAIQDVHNLGALIRSAEAAGAHGVLIPTHHAAGVTPAVRKASSGAVSHIAVARTDLAEALEILRARDVRVVGLAEDGERAYTGVDLTGPVALVVGSEGRGLSAAVARRCDLLVRLPMVGRVESLNAGVAGSIVLYEALRQRGSGVAGIDASV